MKVTDAGWHVGRAWVGTELEDGCSCPQEACGLVATPDALCGQHAVWAAKTMRQGHDSARCPARARP